MSERVLVSYWPCILSLVRGGTLENFWHPILICESFGFLFPSSFQNPLKSPYSEEGSDSDSSSSDSESSNPDTSHNCKYVLNNI